MQRAQSIEDVLFVQQTMADERAVRARFIGGRFV
jgi:hypothetical protein